MKRNVDILLIGTCLLLLQACGVKKNFPESFVKEHRTYDFSLFKNYEIEFRSNDWSHRPIYIIYAYQNKGKACTDPIQVIYDHYKNRVISARNNYGEKNDACMIDTSNITPLLKAFDQLKIGYLFVDSNSNVFVCHH